MDSKETEAGKIVLYCINISIRTEVTKVSQMVLIQKNNNTEFLSQESFKFFDVPLSYAFLIYLLEMFCSCNFDT